MKKSFFFLITGEILFHTKEGEVGQMRVNAVVTNNKPQFPAMLIGKAQQALQLNFFKMANDPTATVVNVVLTFMCNLGYMSEEEFHATPEGMKIEEKAASTEDPFKSDPINPVENSSNSTVN